MMILWMFEFPCKQNQDWAGTRIIDLGGLHAYSSCDAQTNSEEPMAKYLQCSECGKLAFYYDDYVGTEKPFYKRFMRYPEGETKLEPPRCFSCGWVPRLIHQNIKEEKAAAKH